MLKIAAIFVVFSIIQYSYGLSLESLATNCQSNDECNADECCKITNPFIMSKRQSLLDLTSISILDLNKGTCKKYIKEGGDCSNAFFDSCGCEPGTSCLQVESESVNINGKIVIIRPPGTYLCKRK